MGQRAPDASCRPLLTEARTSLAAFFEQHDHRPSEHHWDALDDILSTLQDMADGICPAEIRLSSCDPGTGKSQCVIHFLRTLLRHPAYDGVGAVIFVRRIEEAEDLAKDLAVADDRVAVLTSDFQANALGKAKPNLAQVLITTQKMFETHHRGSFEGAADFHYRDSPRQVRIWEEAWLPGEPISLNRDTIASMFEQLRCPFPGLVENLEDFFRMLGTMNDGALLQAPAFGLVNRLAAGDVLAGIPFAAENLKSAVETLFWLSGRTVRVCRDGPSGNSIIGYQESLLTDLLPILVLDASGRVRETYADIAASRGKLRRLRPAVKDYRPLKLHIWNKGGSKSSWRRNAKVLLEGICNTIRSKPWQSWLIVHHKPSNGVVDVEDVIRRSVSREISGRVAFLRWGSHQATNKFRDYENVILAGTLFYRKSFLTALAYLAQGKPVEHELKAEDIDRVTSGEYCHLLLQSIGRGRIRKLADGRCQPMAAYIIASPTSGIPDLLGTVFPNCQIMPWEPLQKRLTGRIGEAIRFVTNLLADGAEVIPYTMIRDHLGMARQNFSTLVTQRVEWDQSVMALGLVSVGGRGRPMELRRRSPAAGNAETTPM